MSKSKGQEIDFSHRVTVPTTVLIRELDGEAVILNLDTGIYFGLDDTGTRMWGVLSSSESIQEAFDQLLEEYEVEPEILTSELNRFLKELLDNQLTEIGPRVLA